MPLDTENNGFLSRWSRRKAQVRQGVQPEVLERPAVVFPHVLQADQATSPADAAKPLAVQAGGSAQPTLAPVQTGRDGELQPAPEPLPTLADVAELTRESNYARFVQRQVQPDVKNAALAKLFTDPHFNVMDGLDVYIDDYGKPDPLPAGMLRQMLQAHVLGLFNSEDEPVKTADTESPAQTVPPLPTETATETPTDENTDLHLQPDDVAGCASLEPGAGQDPGCPH